MSDPRLKELREAMAELEASRAVEASVMAEFRSRKQGRPAAAWTGWMRWAVASIMVVLVAAAMLLRPGEEKRPVEVSTVQSPPAAPPTPEVERPQPAKKAAVRPARRPRPKVRSAPPPRTEFATDFIALPYAPPLYAEDGGQVVRVQLPRLAMRSVGLPVMEERAFERVPADVLLGQDGIARAVRFVSVAQ